MSDTLDRTRLRFVLREVDERHGPADLPLLAVTIRDGVVRRDSLTDDDPRAADLSAYKRCAPGDIVLNRMRAFQGALGVAPVAGLVSPDYSVLRVAPHVDARYVAYLLRSAWGVGQMAARLRGIGGTANGAVRTPRVNVADLGSIAATIPYQRDQALIADFLDHEYAQISELDAGLRRFAALEWDNVRSVRAEALAGAGVTVALRYCGTVLDHMRIPLNQEERSRRPGPYPYWGANSIQGHVDDFLFDEELVLIGEDGAPFFEPRRDVAWTISGKVWVNNHAHILRARDGWLSDYLAEALNDVDYSLYITGATRDKLTQEGLRAIRIPKRSLEAQRVVVSAVRAAKERYSKVEDKVQRLQAALDEYRVSVTTEAVMGGLDLQEHPPRRPDRAAAMERVTA